MVGQWAWPIVRRLSCFAAGALLLGAGCTLPDPSKALPPLPEAHKDSAGDLPSDAKAAYQRLREYPLDLSTVDRSFASSFFVFAELYENEDGVLRKQFDMRVTRNGELVALLVRSRDELPYLYATNNLCIWVSDDASGALCVCTTGMPHFLLGLAGGKLRLEGGHYPVRARPDVLVDTSAVLLAAADGRMSYEPELHRLVSSFPQTGISMAFSLRADRARDLFPLSGWSASRVGGTAIAVRGIRTGESAGDADIGITLRDIQPLGLPIRYVERPGEDGLHPVPRDFGVEAKQMAASKAIARILEMNAARRRKVDPGKPSEAASRCQPSTKIEG